MKIHQLQASYQIEQDRVLVRLNTHSGEEVRLWLTRRLTKNLFPHIFKAAAALTDTPTQLVSHDGADPLALTQFRMQESIQQADFSTPFVNEAPVLPMGHAPLLATTVQITPAEGGNLRLGFEESISGTAGIRSFEITLDPPLLHAFTHLLQLALKNSDWGIVPDQLAPSNDTPALDAFGAAEPPKYLN